MQGKENTGECITLTELSKAMYPGKCGYKSNTGGMYKNVYIIESQTLYFKYYLSLHRRIEKLARKY